MTCWRCDSPVQPDDERCATCGAVLEPSRGRPSDQPAALPPPPGAAEQPRWAGGGWGGPGGGPTGGYDLGDVRPASGQTAPPTSEGGPNWVLIGGIAVLVVVFLIGATAVFAGRSSPPTAEEQAAATSTTTKAPIPTSFPPPPTVSVPPGGFDAEQLGQNFGDAVYRVNIDGCGVQGSGSGFAVDPYHLVTNWHVAVADTEPTLTSRSGKQIQGHVIGMNQKPDVAVIAVDDPLPTYLEWAPTSTLGEGQELVAMGYPLPATDFTLTKLTISSFETTGDRRTGIRVDGKIDRGNSGGPSLTLDGKVAGVNTSVNINAGAPTGAITGDGFQIVPYLGSTDGLKDTVDGFLATPGAKTVASDCSKVRMDKAKTYGDNAQLDAAWDACAAGESAACDALAGAADPESDYYKFGVTCGSRESVRGYCYARWGPTLPN